MNPFGIAIATFLVSVGVFFLWGLCAAGKRDEEMLRVSYGGSNLEEWK